MTDTLERGTRERPARQPRRKRSRWRSMLFVTLLVALGLVATGVLPVQQFLHRNAQVNDAATRLAALEERNAELADDAEALLTDDEVERIAREQYGFVMPGEVGYVVVPSDDENAVADTEDPVPVPSVDDRGFFQRVWDFITGRDVAGDG